MQARWRGRVALWLGTMVRMLKGKGHDDEIRPKRKYQSEWETNRDVTA